MKYYLLLIPLLFMLVGEWPAKAAPQASARIVYEGLALHTPETAVETFVEAFQRDDFYAVYLIFSRTTQISIATHINSLNYSRLINATDVEAREILADTPLFQMMDTWEHQGTFYLFDTIMLAAKEHSAFMVDLNGNLSIAQVNKVDGARQADVYATVEGIEGEVLFRLEQAPSGRWRITQLVLPGGDEMLIPWAVPGSVD